jgi:hypothetical protein
MTWWLEPWRIWVSVWVSAIDFWFGEDEQEEPNKVRKIRG